MNSGQYQDDNTDDMDLSLGLRRELINRGVTPDRFGQLANDENYKLLANEHFSNVKNEFFPEGLKKGGVFVTRRSKKSKGPKQDYPGPPTGEFEDVPNQIENVQYEAGEDGIQEIRRIEYIEPNGRRMYYDIKGNKTADNPRVDPIKPGQTLNEQNKQKGLGQNIWEGAFGPSSPMDFWGHFYKPGTTTVEKETLPFSSLWTPEENKFYQETGNVPPGRNLNQLNAMGRQPWENQSTEINQVDQGLHGLFGQLNAPANLLRSIKDIRNGKNIKVDAPLLANNPNHQLAPGELPYATNPNTGMGYQKLPSGQLFGQFEKQADDTGLTTAGKSLANAAAAAGNFGIGLGEFLTSPGGYGTLGMGSVAKGSLRALGGAGMNSERARQALSAAKTEAEKKIAQKLVIDTTSSEAKAALIARTANTAEAALQGKFAYDLGKGSVEAGIGAYDALTEPKYVPGPDKFTEGGYVGTEANYPKAAGLAVDSIGNAIFARQIGKSVLHSGKAVVNPEKIAAQDTLGDAISRLANISTVASPEYNQAVDIYQGATFRANPIPLGEKPVNEQRKKDLEIKKQQEVNVDGKKYQIVSPDMTTNKFEIPKEILEEIRKESQDPSNLIAGSTGRPSRGKPKDVSNVKPEDMGRRGEEIKPGEPVLKPGDTPEVAQPPTTLAEQVASVAPKPELKAPEVAQTKPEAPAAESPANKAAQARLNRELDKIEERRAFTQANLESGRITQELADTYFSRFDFAEKKAQDTFMRETQPSQRILGVDVGNTGRTTVWNNQGLPRPQPEAKPRMYSATVEPPKPDAKPTIPGLPQMPMSALEAASDATKMSVSGQTKSQFADRGVPSLNGKQAFEKNNGMLSRLTYDQLKDLHDTTVAEPGHNPKFAAAVRDEMGSRERKVSDTYSTNQEGRNAISSNLKPELMTDADLKNVTDNHPALIQKQREIITGHNRGDFNSDLGKRSAEAEAAIRKLNELKYQLKFAREEANKRVRVNAGVARPDGTPIVASTERKLTAKRYDPITGEEVKGPVVKRNPVQALNHARGDLGLLSRDELIAARDALKAQGRDYYKKVDEAIQKRDLENERVHKRLYGSKAAEMPNPRTMDRAEIDRRLAELPGELKQAEERYAQTKSPEDAKEINDIKTDLSGLRKEVENRDNLESQSLQYDRSKNPNYKQVSGDIQGVPQKPKYRTNKGPFKIEKPEPQTKIEGRDPDVIRAEGDAAYQAENERAARTANQETIDRANQESAAQKPAQTAPAEVPMSEARQTEIAPEARQAEPAKAEPAKTEPAKPDLAEEQAAKQETVSSINDNADILDNMDSTKEVSRILNGTRKESGLVEQIRKSAEEWNNAKNSAEREVAERKMQDHIDELTNIRDEMQERHDNTPESLQSTDAYDRREQMISDLEEAISGLEEQMYNMKDYSKKDLGDLRPESNKSLSREDIKRQEGNRQYNANQLSSQFIGRIAAENPGLTNNLKIKFKSEISPDDTTTVRHQLLLIGEKGEEVGSIYVDARLGKQRAYLSSSYIDSELRGQKLGTLMYSEIAERLRSFGINELTGWIADSKGRPNKIRQKVIDAVNNELGYKLDKTGDGKGDVKTTLRPEAYYSPEYQASREVQVGVRNLDRIYSGLSAGQKEVALTIEQGNKTVADVLNKLAEQGVNKGDSGFLPNEGKIARLILKNADATSLSAIVRATDQIEIVGGSRDSVYSPAGPNTAFDAEAIGNSGGVIPSLKYGNIRFSRHHLEDPKTSMQVVLHEITHAVTVDKVNRAIFGISNSYNTGSNKMGESGAKYIDRVKAYIKDPNADRSVVKIARAYLKFLSTLDKDSNSAISLSKANKATKDINEGNVVGSGTGSTREAQRQGIYGATNLNEFIAEAMSNPDFQARLRSIKMGEKSVWEHFKKSVAEMLGIAESDTALAHTMDGVMEISGKRLENIQRPGVSYEDSLQKVREQRFQSEGDIIPSQRARIERERDSFNIRKLNSDLAQHIKSIRDIDGEIKDVKTPGNYSKEKVDALEAQKDILISKAQSAMEQSPYYDTALKNVGRDADFDTIATEINHLNALDQRGDTYNPRNYESDVNAMRPESSNMPARTSNLGNRTYTEKQMAQKFIGRVARDNPGFAKQFKVEFEVSDRETGPKLTDKSEIDLEHEIEMENAYLESQKQIRDTEATNRKSTLEQESLSGEKYNEDLGFEDTNYNPTPGSRPPGTSVARLWITDKNGKNVGTIHVSIDEVKSGVAHLAESRIEKDMQGQGIGKLMYSELAERLRSMGIKELTGWIADSKLRPNKIRQRIIDAVNNDLGYPDKTSMKKEAISTTLRPEAFYSPERSSQTPVFNMTPESNRMPAGESKGSKFIAEEKQAAANAVQSVIEGFNMLKPETMKDLKDTGVGVVTLGWLRGSSAQLDRLAKIHNIPEITEVRALLMGNNPGEMFRARGEGFHTAVSAQNKVFQNKLNNILKPFESELKLLDKDAQAAKLEEIGRAIVNPRTHRDPAIAEAVKQFRAVFKELHDYQRKAGIDVGDWGGTYVPRVLKVDKVLENSEAFIDTATKAYRQSGLTEAEAKRAAQDWFDNILNHDEGFSAGDGGRFIFDSGNYNGEPKHTRDRVFSADAERIMEPFYNRNIYDALTTYIGRSVKSAELTRRFGVDFNKYKDMQDRIIAKGPNGAGILSEVNTLLASQIASGQLKTKTGRMLADANTLYQSVRFLTNATLSSLSEPIVNGMRTGRVMDAVTGMGNSIQYAYRNARDLAPDYHEKLSRDIGVVQSHLATSAIATSVDTRYLDANSSRFTKTTINGFFRGTGLHQWTEGTRVASVKIGETFISRLASDIADGGKPYQLAARLFNELGVTDHKAMSNFIKRLESMPEPMRLKAINNTNSKVAQEYRQALRKYSEQVIMNPNAGVRSKLAAHPLGQFIFGLQSYLYAFHENVLKRMGRVLVNEALLNKGNMSPANRMMLMGGFMSAPLFLAAQYMQGEVRDELFTDPARAGDPPLTLGTKLARMISRAGAVGRLDAPLNLAAGLRYNKSPETAFVGPSISDASSTGAEIFRMFQADNSEKTNTQERKTYRSMYNTFLQPSISTAASHLPGVTGRLASTGIHYTAKHPGMREAVVGEIAGPPVAPRKDKKARENWYDERLRDFGVDPTQQ